MRVANTAPPSSSFAGFHPFLQQALLLESRPVELLSYRTPHLPYWGLIRLALMIRLLDKIRGENSAGEIYLRPKHVGPLRSLRYVASSLRRSPFRYADKDVVFFCSGVNKRSENGVYVNTRVDYFVERLQGWRTLLIEGADDLRYAWPRAVQPVSYRGGLTAPAAMRARIVRLSQAEQRSIREFMGLLADTFSGILDRADCELLEGYLRRSILRSNTYYATCCRLFEQLKPRIVFMENAHSGFDIEFTVAAKDCNIITVEYQHGAINPLCPYHNFHPAILAAGYSKYLPDYFLSYGDFWNGLLTTSAEVISIGNPHVAAMKARVPQRRPQPNSVYFLSSANAPSIYIAKLRELAAEGYSIVFRPHPVERPLLKERYGTFFDDMKIRVDLGNDFYGQIPDHEFVIGDGRSTSLFEACAIAAGRVFVLETNATLSRVLPNHSFLKTLVSAKELRSALTANVGEDVPVDSLFAPNWEERFSRFMSMVLESGPARYN